MTAEDDRLGWNAFATEFEEHAVGSAYNALYDRPAVLDLLGDVRGTRVLDVGCGPGLYAEALIERGAEVIGLDASPEMVALARRRIPGFDARVHDLETPIDWLPSASFDLEVAALVVHHVDGRGAMFDELFRLLRPGGRLVVSTHHPTNDWMRLGGSYFEIEAVEEDWHDGRWHVRYWRQPLERTCAEFTDAGFMIERVVEPQPHPDMASRYPEDHAKLTTDPAFIAFRLLKPA
jgi:SAM-dependent methyltransferase